MSQYTTGEMAKLCNITVRTVQFYDTKDLLKPTELSEGGRRHYSDSDLQKLRMICLLKSLGLALDPIKGILESESPENVLLLLLDQQEKEISEEIRYRHKQLDALRVVRESIRNSDTIPVQSIHDIERMMKSKKKLRKVHGSMLAVGIVMDIILIATVLLWAIKGYRIPFFVGLPIVILLGIMLTRLYNKSTAYICPECNVTFHPSMQEMLFSKHTPKTRKLKCPECGNKSYCVEVANIP